MASVDRNRIFEIVRANAFNHLTSRQRETTNLYLDTRVREKGETLGPAFQKIVVDKPSILVFADDHPRANFAHSCRYLLFDPETGKLRRELHARFPPYATPKAPETLVPFHEPVRIKPNTRVFKTWPRALCPVLIPDGSRYAILYSGMSNLRHLNDLEFCYRMLVDRYGFKPANIYALSYDGTMDTQDGAPTTGWPGDGTAYRIKITGKGDRASFQAALNDLKTKLHHDDLLFIHTNNHGGNSSGQSFLCAYPSWGTYWANDFASDLAGLPKYRSLIAMMEQCEAGGFNSPVISNSTAANTSISSAAPSNESSWGTSDGNFDVFALEWIAAQFGHNADGTSLATNADTDGDGVVEAEEAYGYADSQDTADTPTYDESSEAGGDITLGQKYDLWWMWCWIWRPILEKYYQPHFPDPPDPEFFVKLQSVLPEVQKLVVPLLNRGVADARKQAAEQAEAAVAKAFGNR